MKTLTEYEVFVIKLGPEILLEKHPETYAIAHWTMGCGCIVLRCVSEIGEPIDRNFRFCLKPEIHKGSDICHKCLSEGRIPDEVEIVRAGISWLRPTTEQHRDFISEKVFGPDNVTIERLIL